MTVEAAKTAAPVKAAASADRGRRKIAVGLVTSTKMQKTIAISVDRIVRHGKFEKQLTRQTVFKAHDEKSEAKLGDLVEIVETRPLSKTKRWRLVRIVRKSQLATVTGAQDTHDVSKVKGGQKGKKKDEKPVAGTAAKAETPGKGKEK
ncbi:MAG: 30S ribosomal protein S17 [Planctomycetes bacterium]|nr:30S ribosomal protein S17 [Planctomycetota bacterium]